MVKRSFITTVILLSSAVYAQQPSPQERLSQAANTGNVAEAKAAVKAGANPNQGFGSMATYGGVKAVRTLVEAGADVNSATSGGWTPLMGAADEGKLETVKYLVSKKANVNAKTRQGRTAAIRAAYHDRAEVIEFLLSKGANVNEADSGGVTALMLAAQAGHEKTVKVLLAAGADKVLKSAANKTALNYAQESLTSHERGLKEAKDSIKANPKAASSYEFSVKLYQDRIAQAKKTIALLTGADKKSLGKLVGKVFSADGKKLTITGKNIGDLTVGTKLVIKTANGEISATISEILHSKAKAKAKKDGAEKGDAVHLAK